VFIWKLTLFIHLLFRCTECCDQFGYLWFNPAGSIVNHDVMLNHVDPGYYSRAVDTRVSDAHTIFTFIF
jgi:hypothetical protein